MLRHNACGELIDAHLICAHCGDEITARNVTPEPGPGSSARPT
jgi:ribosomal protein L32